MSELEKCIACVSKMWTLPAGSLGRALDYNSENRGFNRLPGQISCDVIGHEIRSTNPPPPLPLIEVGGCQLSVVEETR